MKKLILTAGLLLLLLSVIGCSQNKTLPGLSSEITGNNPNQIQIPDVRHAMGLDKPVIQRVFDDIFSNGGDPVQFSLGPSSNPTPTPTTAPALPVLSSDGNQSISQINQDSVRLIVRTGNIQMVVNQIAAAMHNISQLSTRYGGYIVSSQQWKEGDRNIGNISIRVLSENYEKAFEDIKSLAKSVTNEASNSQDVTQEYTDLDAKVKNLETTESQLKKIMETASKTDDILTIQRELTSVRGEIDQIHGQMQYMERTSSTSLIDVKLEEAVLVVKFSAEKISGNTDEPIIFKADVVGGFEPYNYFWDFGDGKTSNEKSPTHIYKSVGTYPVGLKVTDDKGYTNTYIRNSYINIVAAWNPSNDAHNAWSGLAVFAKGLSSFLVWLAVFSFVWVPIGAIVWYFAFYRRRRNKIRTK